jgi:hypothetical protein
VVELADLRGEIGDEGAEMLLLQRKTVFAIELDECGELAGLDAVVALFVDHSLFSRYATRRDGASASHPWCLTSSG